VETNYIALISITVALLLIIVQRSEETKRRIVWTVVILCFLIIRHNAFIKGNLHDETLFGFIIGFIISGLFWALIGKYNPVGSSDSIQVMGMDD
jgi:hypothetical protein